MKEEGRIYQSAKFGRVHIFVLGRVQGVWFREKTKQKAEEFGVFGWVRNLSNGRVEAVFEGKKNKVEQMIKWARNGPFLANVTGLDIVWEEYKNEFNFFEVKLH